MSNIHSPLLRLAASISVFTGFCMAVANGKSVEASLSGIGSSVLTHPAAPLALQQGPVTSVTLFEQTQSIQQFAIGLLLILLGFFLHAFLLSRSRSVHITVAPKQSVRSWFWIEMRV